MHSDPGVLPEWPREPLTQTPGLRRTLWALDLGTGGVVSHCRSRAKFGIGRSRSRAGPAHAGFKSVPLRVAKICSSGPRCPQMGPSALGGHCREPWAAETVRWWGGGGRLSKDRTPAGEMGVDTLPALPRKWPCVGLEQVRNGVTLPCYLLSCIFRSQFRWLPP